MSLGRLSKQPEKGRGMLGEVCLGQKEQQVPRLPGGGLLLVGLSLRRPRWWGQSDGESDRTKTREVMGSDCVGLHGRTMRLCPFTLSEMVQQPFDYAPDAVSQEFR